MICEKGVRKRFPRWLRLLNFDKEEEHKQFFATTKDVNRILKKLVGLSALMTATVPAMKKTIRLFRKELPDVRIAVGGAVLNESCAKQIGADRHCAETMDTVRYIEEIYRK